MLHSPVSLNNRTHSHHSALYRRSNYLHLKMLSVNKRITEYFTSIFPTPRLYEMWVWDLTHMLLRGQSPFWARKPLWKKLSACSGYFDVEHEYAVLFPPLSPCPLCVIASLQTTKQNNEHLSWGKLWECECLCKKQLKEMFLWRFCQDGLSHNWQKHLPHSTQLSG